MKWVKKILFIAQVLLITLASYAQMPVVTITDGSGNSHVRKNPNGPVKSNHDFSTFHDLPGREIYLHSMGIGAWWNVTYWHAKIIHTGYHLGSNHFPETQCVTCSTDVIGGAKPTDNNGQVTTMFGEYTSYENNHTSFRTHNNGKDLNWYQGFIVCDGCEWNGHFGDNGEPDISQWDEGKYHSAKTGVVILRADEQVILGDGFRAVKNPDSKGHNTHEYTIDNISAVNFRGAQRINVHAPNHFFYGALDVDGNVSDPIDIVEQRFLGSGMTAIDAVLGDNKKFSVVRIDADNYVILREENSGSDMFWPFTDNSIDVTVSRAKLAWSPVPVPNAYFHAYSGPDRFASDLWADEGNLDVNFTDQNTKFYNPHGNQAEQDAKFRKLSACGSPYYSDRGKAVPGYNPDMEDWDGKGYNPNNVVFPTTDPLVNGVCLNLRYTPEAYSCETPFHLVHDIHDADNDGNTSEFIKTQRTTTQGSPSGICTDGLGRNHCADQLDTDLDGDDNQDPQSTTDDGIGYAPLYSLHFGKVEWVVKFGKKSSHFPALWSYQNLSDNTNVDASSLNNDQSVFSRYGNCDRAQSISDCWKNDMSCGGMSEIDAVDASSNWYNNLWTDTHGSNTSSQWSGGVFGEDEVYHYNVATFAFLPYAEFGGVNAFTANFMQIPGNSDNADNLNGWKSFSDDFHTISYEWIPGEIRFRIGDADGSNMVEVGRTTRHVPDGYGMNIYARNQPNHGFPHQTGESDLFIRSIKAWQLDPAAIANKEAPSTEQPNNLSRSISKLMLSNVIPNPANGRITFGISLEGKDIINTPLKIEAYNTLGQLMYVLFDDFIQEPRSSYSFEISSLSSGTYYLRASSGNHVATKPFIIQR